MLDTGAQLTVIGSRVGARLGLDHNNPEFEVKVYGVSGEWLMAPGFYIDAIDIPALGNWLSLTNVPVILLDIASPEGGSLDGIIGMNIFNDFNLVLEGGGLTGEDDPTLQFQHVAAAFDIAPEGGDGIIDHLDLATLIDAWLAIEDPPSPNWNPICDIAPAGGPDGVVNLLDFAALAQYWLVETF